jgi:hypothetical protein
MRIDTAFNSRRTKNKRFLIEQMELKMKIPAENLWRKRDFRVISPNAETDSADYSVGSSLPVGRLRDGAQGGNERKGHEQNVHHRSG